MESLLERFLISLQPKDKTHLLEASAAFIGNTFLFLLLRKFDICYVDTLAECWWLEMYVYTCDEIGGYSE